MFLPQSLVEGSKLAGACPALNYESPIHQSHTEAAPFDVCVGMCVCVDERNQAKPQPLFLSHHSLDLSPHIHRHRHTISSLCPSAPPQLPLSISLSLMPTLLVGEKQAPRSDQAEFGTLLVRKKGAASSRHDPQSPLQQQLLLAPQCCQQALSSPPPPHPSLLSLPSQVVTICKDTNVFSPTTSNEHTHTHTTRQDHTKHQG